MRSHVQRCTTNHVSAVVPTLCVLYSHDSTPHIILCSYHIACSCPVAACCGDLVRRVKISLWGVCCACVREKECAHDCIARLAPLHMCWSATRCASDNRCKSNAQRSQKRRMMIHFCVNATFQQQRKPTSLPPRTRPNYDWFLVNVWIKNPTEFKPSNSPLTSINNGVLEHAIPLTIIVTSNIF